MGKTFRRDDDYNFRDTKDRRKKDANRFRQERCVKEEIIKDPTIDFTDPNRERQKDSLYYRQW
jgi:hypothetical protein